jgi:tetratricopeptide (TPR) repeat protein
MVVVFGRNRLEMPFGWFWFLGMLMPVIGLIQAGIQSMADRYTYLPTIGLLVIIVWRAGSLMMKSRAGQRILPVAGAAAIVFCAASARSQIAYWKNTETLFQHALQVTKDNYVAEENVASALNLEGRFDEAFTHIQAALRIKPDYAEAHNDMGGALLSMGRLDEAVLEFQMALRLDPRNAKAHSNLGAAYGLKGQVDEAINELQTALEIDPVNSGAGKNLAKALDLKKSHSPPQKP